ncbi:MAG: hypothetical protein ACLQVF_03115 [Isosphaeraceae bacterium]
MIEEFSTTDSTARPSRNHIAREGIRILNHEKHENHERGTGSKELQPMVDLIEEFSTTDSTEGHGKWDELHPG